MASTYATPIMFAKEKNLFMLFATLKFGAAGAVTLVQPHSKGLCSASLVTYPFTGTTANASPTVTAVSSFVGLYPGMVVQDSGPTNVNQAITSMNGGAGTITLAGNATGTNTGLTASGGAYRLQFGQQAGVRLDTYNTLLAINHQWNQSGSQGSASVLALAPNAPNSFVVQNNIGIRTIPSTAATAITDASIVIQFGSGSGATFTAAVPNNGDVCLVRIALGNSTAP